MTNEARQTFHQQLAEVKTDVARLAAMVTDVIPRGTQVLLNGDMEGAKSLIEHDDELDRLTLHIEEQCYQLLVLQQPMAGDLRVIVSALRMASEIERSGDLVVNIAKTMRRIYGDELTPRIRGLIEQMSEEAARLYKAAIDAYLDEDDALAAAIDDMDDVLDSLQKDFIESVIAAHEDDKIDLNAAVQLALIARYYERIGDHAVNMGERVQYLVTGWLPEHGTAAVADARERHRPGPVEAALAEPGRRGIARTPCASSSPTTTAYQSHGIGVLAGAVAAAGHDVVVCAPGPGPERVRRRHRHLARRRAHRRPGRRAARTPPTSGPSPCGARPRWPCSPPTSGPSATRPTSSCPGINPGLNTGRATLHSGTVGAALTAANLGLKGLAVSQDYGDPMLWPTAAALAVEALGWLERRPRPHGAQPQRPQHRPPRPSRASGGRRWPRSARSGPPSPTRPTVACRWSSARSTRACPPESDTALVFAGYAAVSSLVGIRVGEPLAVADDVGPPDPPERLSRARRVRPRGGGRRRRWPACWPPRLTRRTRRGDP